MTWKKRERCFCKPNRINPQRGYPREKARVRSRGDPGAVSGHYIVITFPGQIGSDGV